MTKSEKYRELILVNIISFGTYESPVSARYIYNKSDKEISLDDFQRVIAKVVDSFQQGEIEKMEERKNFQLILSTNEGYFIPKNEGEALAGIIFYSNRMLPMFARRKKLKRMAQMKFQKKMQYYKKDIKPDNQIGMF